MTRSAVFDVTGSVDVTDPKSVCQSVIDIMLARYTGADFTILNAVYDDFSALYQGRYAGYVACETPYHDIQHVLDVSLAVVRLIDGYDKTHIDSEQLGAELAVLAVIVALFHDSGYIRTVDDSLSSHGAEYTKTHVSRSADFLNHYLPSIGLEKWVSLSKQLVHFTGYEIAIDDIAVTESKHRILGALIGTGDVIAQMADVAYLDKCRDRLYPEFELGGMLTRQRDDGSVEVFYSSPEDLLIKTPAFMSKTITERLDGHFGSVYHYMDAHFDGPNYYMRAVETNYHYLQSLLKKQDLELLKQPLNRCE